MGVAECHPDQFERGLKMLDKSNLFSDDQAITVSAASKNVIDLGAVDSKIQSLTERGNIAFFAMVTAEFAGLTDLSFVLQTADDEAFSSPSNLLASGPIAAADLTVGYAMHLKAGLTHNEIKRYVRMYYTVNGEATAGKITAGYVFDAMQTNNVNPV